MRTLLGATIAATLMFACGNPPKVPIRLAAASSASAASETLSYTVTYLGASQQGQATLTNGKVTLRIKQLPRGQSGRMQIELASGSAKKFEGAVNGLKITDKVQTKRLMLSHAKGEAAPVQTAAQESVALEKRRAKYCSGGGFGGGFDDFDNGAFGRGGFDDFDDFNDGRRGNFGRNGNFGRDGFDDDRFLGNGNRRTEAPGSPAKQPEAPVAPAKAEEQAAAAQEGELILELVAPKG